MLPSLADLHYLVRSLDPPASDSEVETDFARWAADKAVPSMFGYLVDHRERCGGPGPALETFDRHVRPRVATRAAFATMCAAHQLGRPEVEDYVRQCGGESHQRVALEACAFVAAHFNQQGLILSARQVLPVPGDTRAVIDMFLASVMAPTYADNYLVFEHGIERTWQPLSGLGRGSPSLCTDMTGERITHDWLQSPASRPQDVVVFYVPLVNPLTGRVLTRRRALDIARAVLTYNRERAHSHAFVLADDSGVDSYHCPELADEIQAIGSITGADLGDVTLGRMSNWTLTVVTPRSTFGHAQVSFAATTNQEVLAALGRLSQPATDSKSVATSAASLCLTSIQSIEEENENVAQNLAVVRAGVAEINQELGFDAVLADADTSGGRHTAIRLHAQYFPMPGYQVGGFLTELAQKGLNGARPASALALADIFKWWTYDYRDPNSRLTMRVNLAVPSRQLVDAVRDLRSFTTEHAVRIRQFGDGCTAAPSNEEQQ